jgi:Monooxygenase af470-like
MPLLRAQVASRKAGGVTARALNRTTVDLSAYPDLVVIYLGMRVNSPRGLKTLISFEPKIRESVQAEPDGLLLHENLWFSLFPPHAGMRQYWRDFDTLERWARSLPHQRWWQEFLHDRGGTGFWHEAYSRRGRLESIFIDMPAIGLAAFAPVMPARGTMFSARRRLGMREGNEPPPGITEQELYRR